MDSNYQKHDDEAPLPNQVVVATPVPMEDVMPATAPPAYEQPQTNLGVPNTEAAEAEPWASPALQVDSHQVMAMGKRTCLHKLFLVISVLTGLTALNNIIAQGVAFAFQGSPLMEVILRVYMIILCIIVILIELDKTKIIQDSPIVKKWATRGAFYTFLGVLGIVQHDVGEENYYKTDSSSSSTSSSNNINNYYNEDSDNDRHIMVYIPTPEEAAEWYVWIISVLMVFMGLLYILLGFFCLQPRYERLKEDYQNRIKISDAVRRKK